MIKLTQVAKTYSTKRGELQALAPTDLFVRPQQIYGIIGGSGAGKSTLLRCVNLLETPTQGTVEVNGQLLTSLTPQALREARQQIGMIFQHFNLFQKTVFDNIALPMRLANKSRSHIEARVRSLLSLVGLEGYEKAYPGSLSGGQKQRVAIARALANEPKLLLSDEATSALDPQTTDAILSLLQDINETLGVTILLITHEMDVIKQICDRVAVLEKGVMIEEGDVIDIFMQPQHPTTQSFVAKCMGESLPANLKARIHAEHTHASDEPVLHLSFRGRAAVEPLIAGLVANVGVSVNILQAHLETIRAEACGSMILTLSHAEKLESALHYLMDNGIYVEVLGYVKLA